MRSWWFALFEFACGVALGVVLYENGTPKSAVFTVVWFAMIAWIASPLFFPRSVPASEAKARSAADGRPIIYWRPGCRYCIRLRFRLGWSGRRAHWVNIWKDAEGAGAVRAAADGNETVPTVYVDGKAYVNPDIDYVRAWLSASSTA